MDVLLSLLGLAMNEFYAAPEKEPLVIKPAPIPARMVLFSMGMLAVFYALAFTVNIYPKFTFEDLFIVFVSVAFPFGVAYLVSLLFSSIGKQDSLYCFYICIKWSSAIYGALLLVINILFIIKINYDADNIFDALRVFIENL